MMLTYQEYLERVAKGTMVYDHYATTDVCGPPVERPCRIHD